MVTTLCFNLYPIPVFYKDWLPPATHRWFTVLCTWRPHDSLKQTILSSHMIVYMYKKQGSCSFIQVALLFMTRLSEHERSGTFGIMLKDGMRVSDIARYHNCHPSTTQHFWDRYQDSGTFKERRRSGQPRMATGGKRQLNIYIDDIRSGRLLSVQTNSRAPKVVCFWLFNKNISSQYL